MANFIGADQNHADETTIYWFDIDGQEFGIAESGGQSQAVDCDGHPIDYNEDLLREVEQSCIVTDEIRATVAGI